MRDLQTGRTFLVSVSANGSGGGNGNSQYRSILVEGRYVIFASEASNLILNDTNGVSDIFAATSEQQDRIGKCRATGGGVAAGSLNRSTRARQDPLRHLDGRWVAFESASIDSVEGDTNPTGKIFVRDMQMGITRLANEGAQHSRLGSIRTMGGLSHSPLNRHQACRDEPMPMVMFLSWISRPVNSSGPAPTSRRLWFLRIDVTHRSCRPMAGRYGSTQRFPARPTFWSMISERLRR